MSKSLESDNWFSPSPIYLLLDTFVQIGAFIQIKTRLSSPNY